MLGVIAAVLVAVVALMALGPSVFFFSLAASISTLTI
jgi:hypothetical protein